VHTITLEFDDEVEVREEAERLWRKHKISGEIGIRPVGGGRWRLELNAERELKQSTVEKLRGRLIEA
jgi:hypothetical protein